MRVHYLAPSDTRDVTQARSYRNMTTVHVDSKQSCVSAGVLVPDLAGPRLGTNLPNLGPRR